MGYSRLASALQKTPRLIERKKTRIGKRLAQTHLRPCAAGWIDTKHRDPQAFALAFCGRQAPDVCKPWMIHRTLIIDGSYCTLPQAS